MTPLRTLRTFMAAALVVVGTAASFALTTQAKDLSLPYRSYPGFTCHRWNAQNECVDFSYFENTPSYPSYPSYPSHPGPFTSGDDISVSVTTPDDEVDEDEQILYRITLRNNSNYSQRVDVRGFLDEDTDFVRASDGGDDEDDDEVRWDDVSVNARSSRTITLTVRTDDDLNDGDTLRFRVEAGDDEDSVNVEVDTDSNDDDDDDCDNDDCDVTVRVTASDDEVEENDLLTYSIYVRNDDSRDQRVDVRGFLDGDTTYYSISDGGRRVNGDEVEWDNILVGRRSSRTLSVTVRVDDNVDDGDTLTFRAEAGDDEDDVSVDVDDDDHDDDDDDDNEDCDNDDDCDVTLTVSASPTNPDQNALVTFRIVLRNHDDDDHTVDVSGLLDDDLAFYSASDRGRGSSNDDEVEWDNINVDGDSSRTLTVSARVRSQADNGDRLRFEAETNDDSDSVTVRVR